MRILLFSVIVILCIVSFLYKTYPLRYYDTVKKKSELLDPLLIISVMYVESGFRERAVSPKGAIGLMQIMPATADWLSRTYNIDGNINDPEDNITYGIVYLEYLMEKFGDIDKALIA
ncbi:MAG TPA: lytic transglycosylase domain-containing protein, partial [Thermotoga sp.]|nr:lytic transglycosylase domain-containing protein [Thermotoga sp.]